MNILIAVIVTVIMLLLGGAGYHRHNQNVYRDRMWDELDNLERTKDGQAQIIRTEEHLNALLNLKPNQIRYHKIELGTDLTEERVHEIAKRFYREDPAGADGWYVSQFMQQIIRENPVEHVED
jgi:hypothetical protein